jgi:hypothetical protein
MASPLSVTSNRFIFPSPMLTLLLFFEEGKEQSDHLILHSSRKHPTGFPDNAREPDNGGTKEDSKVPHD